ncbi:VOC family protein [Clostridium tyrobutyricum]|uniref:VOC family protein n=1 Tax=Clostridium tyrobutyricum TaxID=1519 RepID=UPI001C389B92|nr:VOC family protein [Clostridium tyrobutyricum]MBV4419151.1 VOC family protein [Clostridium tyrobutyricum]
MLKFKFDHNNINVLNLEKTVKFYEEALGFREIGRKISDDNSFILVFMGDGQSNYKIELTWLRDRKKPYNLGDNEIHMAVTVDDFDAAYKHHKEMGCICYENKKMGLYFIADPDGYWTEILPAR